jgi:hypothetical protein
MRIFLGTVTEQRSNFRISIISDIFWTVFDVVGTVPPLSFPFHLNLGIFFQTLINPSYRPKTIAAQPAPTKLKKGPNVRGLKQLGQMNCAAGG